jgi:hypothetical protein
VVEGHADLASGDPVRAKSLTQRLDEDRKAMLDYVSGAPLPHSLADEPDPFIGVAPEPAPAVFDGPVPLDQFSYPPDFPVIETGNGTPATAETKPLVPLDVTMPGDEIDQALLRELDAAVAASKRAQPEPTL